MNKRKTNRELIRLTATVRVVRMLGYQLTYLLANDSAFWHEFWLRLAPSIGWNKQDEERLRVVVNNLRPLIADLTTEEQLSKVKEVLAPGWDTADKFSRIHRMMAGTLARVRQKTKPPDST